MILLHVNNKRTNQPAHRCIFIHSIESILAKVSITKISNIFGVCLIFLIFFGGKQ